MEKITTPGSKYLTRTATLIFATRGAAAEPVPEALLVLADLDINL